MKIIFMGTPHFSCPTLEKLISDPNFEVVAVYTKEPQAAGRGQKLKNSPIHDLALKHNLKIFTPKTLRDKEIQEKFFQFKADVAVVVAYGLILPPEILQNPRFGCINIHPSILPKWRGASPIQRPIINGDSETGVTIIKMDEGLDSGDIIYQENFSLLGHETYRDLSQKLSVLGAEALIKTLKNLNSNNFTLTKQDHASSTYAKKIDKSELEIDWNLDVKEIERKIRGLNGSMEAYFIHNNEKIKIFSAQIIDENSTQYNPGTIIDDQLRIQCGKGILQPTLLQRPGKRAMELKEFLLGFIEKK